MSLFVTSLNSGSNGNCYYVGNAEEAVLIDAGISCRETEKRLARLGLDPRKIKAIFITHEHVDHIQGVGSLVKKYQLPVYITARTFTESGLRLSPEWIYPLQAHTSVKLGNLVIMAFPKFHDAIDPLSMVISCGNVRVGVFTDIGKVCEHVLYHFKQCHAVFLEANYDEELLEKGRYPIALKRRIRGGRGHLSNKEALELFLAHRPSYMSHVFLSHLSHENNHPGLAQSLFQSVAGKTEIVVASRFEETAVYTIRHPNDLPSPPLSSLLVPRTLGKRAKDPSQLSLF